MSSRSVLVFPAGMPPSLAWARRAAHEGLRIVGASSLACDPAQSSYREWVSLPWIGDRDFGNVLGHSLAEKHIDAVFTPHPVVWMKLRDLLPKVAPSARLEAELPLDAELAEYRAYRDIAAGFARDPMQPGGCGELAAPMTSVQLAALVREFQLVPGQCDYSKLEALVAIFRSMPAGDVVEIGSFWGRSAVALAFLAKHYRIGKLLCVDPWGAEDLLQNIPDVDSAFRDTPMEEVFDGFRVNLAPYAGVVNYCRARSDQAAFIYHSERCFTTDDFGWTAYRGEIALLHIDGNHAPRRVREDICAWGGSVRADGWIVFDDYRWPFGDGPRLIADEFLTRIEASVATAFVAGGALFARIKNPLSC